MTRTTIRRGTALLGVLIAISVITIILTVVSAQVFAQRKLLQSRQHQLQAEWLARAGVEWAAERLLQKPSAFVEDIADLAPEGTVRISVEKSDGMVFVVTSAASIRNDNGQVAVRAATAHFQRTEIDGRVHLARLLHSNMKD